MVVHTCNKCNREFNRKSVYDAHMARKIPCVIEKKDTVGKQYIERKVGQYVCNNCGKRFTRSDNLIRHNKNNCNYKFTDVTYKQKAEKPVDIVNNNTGISPDLFVTMINNVKQQLKADMTNQVAEVKQQLLEQHRPIVNNLQVVCVGTKDNYLDMLTEKLGNFDRALEYIKDCALSSLTGDCKLLGKIYFDQSLLPTEHPIQFHDNYKNKLSYLNEKNERILDPKGMQLGKRLANNLQNTYLKGINFIIADNAEKRVPVTSHLEAYDVHLWNRHIFELSDEQYQKKIIAHLEIPAIVPINSKQ